MLNLKSRKETQKTIEELKKIEVEEWNSIPNKIIRKCRLSFIKRI